MNRSDFIKKLSRFPHSEIVIQGTKCEGEEDLSQQLSVSSIEWENGLLIIKTDFIGEMRTR